MNIATLGGSFDPPHKGHAIIANRLLKLYRFDQVWLMPCYQHPFSKNLSSPDKRFEMTKYLKNKNIKISDLEIRKKTTSYTIDSLNNLTTQYPNYRFSWIIGTDQVGSFTKWKNWKEIVSNFRLIIVPRTGFKKAKEELKNISKQITALKNIVLIDKKIFPPIYISSTLARKKIKENKSISNMVPKGVEEYIIKHKLYS